MQRPDFICVDQAGNPHLDITTREECEALGYTWEGGESAGDGTNNAGAKEGKVSATGVDARTYASLLLLLMLMGLVVRVGGVHKQRTDVL
jgi:hypothetical protein